MGEIDRKTEVQEKKAKGRGATRSHLRMRDLKMERRLAIQSLLWYLQDLETIDDRVWVQSRHECRVRVR